MTGASVLSPLKTTYTYAKEALGERASYLKLGMVNPLPVHLILEFARSVGQVYVIEELDDIIETHCRKHGIPVIGRLLFPACGSIPRKPCGRPCWARSCR